MLEIEGLRLIPEHCREIVRDYIVNGTPMGGFLTYVFENDLVGAFGKADEVNYLKMADYVRFLYNHAPANCWGSPEKVKKWIAHKGLSGDNP